MFQGSLESFSSFFADTELRRQCNRTRRIGLMNGDVISNATSEASGINARVFRAGRCGFASSPETDISAVERILKQASDNAAFLADHLPDAGGNLAPRVPVTHRGIWVPDRVPQREILEFLQQIDDYIATRYPHLAARYVGCSCLSLEKELRTNDGVYSYSFMPRSNISVSLTAMTKEGTPVDR